MANPIMHCLQNLLAYPIRHGTIINLVAFHDLEGTCFKGPWVSAGEREEMTSPFLHWEPEVQKLLDVSPFPLLSMLIHS